MNDPPLYFGTDSWLPVNEYEGPDLRRPTSAPPVLESKETFLNNSMMDQRMMMFSQPAALPQHVEQPDYAKYYLPAQTQNQHPTAFVPLTIDPRSRPPVYHSPTPGRFIPGFTHLEGATFQELEGPDEEFTQSRRPPRPYGPQKITPAMNIVPKGSQPMQGVWRPLPTKVQPYQQDQRPRSIPRNMVDPTPLSSSTDDLLFLAGNPGFLPRSYESDDEHLFSHPHFRPQVAPHFTPVIKNNFRVEINSPDMTTSFQNMSLSDGPAVRDVAAPQTEDPQQPKNQICRYFSTGYCSRGERCNYTHVLGNTGTVVPKATHKPARVPTQYTKLADYAKEIYNLCLDQHGCRFLQKELDEGGPQEVNIVFNGVIGHVIELMKDPFGNYLCQKLVEHCDADQRLAIVKGVSSSVVQISKNMHGTRAIQRLIERLQTPEEIKLIRDSFKGSVVALIQDLNGNHVIQKCLRKMEPVDNQFIYDAVAEHCVQVATHRHGCCVLQRCIDHGTAAQKRQLVEPIKRNGVQLVQDPFGNYVVQYALDLGIPGLAFDLMEQLEGELYRLSRQKFSSNVVEKCLKSGDPNCVKRVMRELLLETPDPRVEPVRLRPIEQAQAQILDLLQDSFGNYVIQTCLSEGAVHAAREYVIMVSLIAPYIHDLRNTPHSKRIYHLLNLNTTQEPHQAPALTQAHSVQNGQTRH